MKNGVFVINTLPVFTLGTGEVDDICFDDEENVPLLNRLGSVRLLTSFVKHCPGFKLSRNWMKIKKSVIANTTNMTMKRDQPTSGGQRNYDQITKENSNPSRAVSRSQQSPSTHTPLPTNHVSRNHFNLVTPTLSTRTTPPLQNYQPLTHGAFTQSELSRGHWNPPTRPHSVRVRENTQGHSESPPPRFPEHIMQRGPDEMWRHDTRPNYPRDSSSFPSDACPSATYAQITSKPPPRLPYSNSLSNIRKHVTSQNTQPPISSSNSEHHHNANYPRSTRPRKACCYNCGESNHRQSSCRYDHMIRCHNCHSLGHKSRFCKYYNE